MQDSRTERCTGIGIGKHICDQCSESSVILHVSLIFIILKRTKPLIYQKSMPRIMDKHFLLLCQFHLGSGWSFDRAAQSSDPSIAQCDPSMVARSTDACANDGSLDCAARSIDRADPSIARNIHNPFFDSAMPETSYAIYNSTKTCKTKNIHWYSILNLRIQVKHSADHNH